MKTKLINLEMPDDVNVIFGMSHFIKTVEDIYEAMVGISSTAKFGIAFCEASGPCLIRSDGNDPELTQLAEEQMFGIACGHTFIIYMRDGYPINFLPRLKMIPEVCRIFCATANAVQIVVAETEQGRGVMDVIDGEMPKGIEKTPDKKKHHKFLRDIEYKR